VNFHPPVRLARSAEFLALDCMQRHIFRPLWVRGEERRWPTDRTATADDRLFWELEAIGVLVGPGARAVFELALGAFLRSGAMQRDVEDLVLPILSGDTAKEQPAAATLRKRRQRERERAKGGGGSSGGGGGEGDEVARDMGRDIHPMSRGEVTPLDRDLGRDRPVDSGRDVTPPPASPERREERTFSSSLSENPSVSDESQVTDTARVPEGAPTAPVTRPVTPQVTLSTLTEEEVFGVLERDAGGRIGLHPRSLRPRLLARLAEEGVTREQLAVMARLARERTLYLQDKHAVIDLALLVGTRDGEAKVLGSWINATHRAIARAREDTEREAQRRRDLAPRSVDLPWPVKIQGPPPLAQAAQGGAGPRVPYLAQRRPAVPGGSELQVVPLGEPEGT